MSSSTSLIDEEAHFDIGELFFSVTDRRGVIKSGNDVFVRISGYSLEELLGKPHNIIRHPDMPKTVFKLFWDTLHKNEPIIAYVKNRSKDGRYYWVLAFASPIPDGYLSIRLKPTSDLFKAIPTLYRDILQKERSTNIAGAEAYIMERLNQLGFKDYQSFMIHALFMELESRRKMVDSSSMHFLESMATTYSKARSISDSCESFVKECLTLIDRCGQLNYLGVNMAAESERTGDQGRTLGIVSETFARWGHLVEDAAKHLREPLDTVKGTASSLQISLMMMYFQIEMLFRTQSENIAGLELSEELRILRDQSKSLLEKSRRDSSDFEKMEFKLRNHTAELASALTALEIIRLTGKVETARLSSHESGFQYHIEEMIHFLQDSKNQLRSIDELINSMRMNSQVIASNLSNVRIA